MALQCRTHVESIEHFHVNHNHYKRRNQTASGNGGATLRLPDAVCECYQIASWLEILTEHRDRANQIEVEKAKYYRQGAQ